MSAQRLGSIVGAVFGLVYVLVNAGPLPRAVGVARQALGLAAFVVVLVAVAQADDHGGRPPNAGSRGAYWLVLAAEVAALAAGLAALNGPLDAPQAGVAWVSFVVGVHFVALGAVVSGIVPGTPLLASGWWGARQAAHYPPPAPARGTCRGVLSNRIGEP